MLRALAIAAAVFTAAPVQAAPCESKPVADGSIDGIHVLDLPLVTGLLVKHVTKSSPASCAGVKPGDWIVSVDGARVDEPSDLRRMLDGRTKDARLEVRQSSGTTTVQLSSRSAGTSSGVMGLMTDWLKLFAPGKSTES